jgi:hypothetical protein
MRCLDEKILWSGQPEINLFFTVINIVQIIFALVWLGITGSVGYFAIESFDPRFPYFKRTNFY